MLRRTDPVAVLDRLLARRLLETLMVVRIWNVGDGLCRAVVPLGITENKSENGYSVGITFVDAQSICLEATVAVLSFCRVVRHVCGTRLFHFRIFS